MIITQLLEALLPSQYRSFVKGWDKNKYAEVFKRYTKDPKAYRIYIPIPDSGEPKPVKVINPPADIKAAVEEAGYTITDYVTGMASNDAGRVMKIGKILARSKPELANKFANDPQRKPDKTETKYLCCISRHPYDIAGMSTDRGWTSCMNIGGLDPKKYPHNPRNMGDPSSTDRRGNGRGINHHFVPIDVKEGTIVAYMIENTDKNLNHPLARYAIKPFVDIADDKTIAFGIQNKVYGTANDEFKKVVIQWCDEVNRHKELNGLFVLNDKLYNDEYNNTTKKIGDAALTDQETNVYNRPSRIAEIENPSERLQMIAVKRDPSVIARIAHPATKAINYIIENKPTYFQYISKTANNLTDEMKLKAVQKNPANILAIDEPTDEMMIAAVSQDNYYGKIVRLIGREPSEAVQEAAVKHYPRSIENMTNPSKKLKDFALSKDGTLIEKIDSPSEEQYMLAAQSHKNLLRWMIKEKKKVSEDLMMEMLKHFPAQIRYLPDAPAKFLQHVISHDGHAIEYVLHRTNVNPDLKAALIIAALKQNGMAIKWIDNPTKQQQMAAVKQDPGAIKYIKRPNPAVTKYLEDNGHKASSEGK